MKINNLGPTGINPYKKAINKLDKVSNTTTAKADKVEISSVAKEMQMNQIDAARQKKVEELKQSVQNGTYKADAKATASSIINYFKI
ncbi:flagellar biosynthesis anti-sigma factor FlgM [Robertmurraya korlensis]|uniref:flagellar biosynthesis anti-sigma factor FlgM n=1 Tax=Robertmurraya korlensis TaxID=519977 RepID=UPI0008254F27|nr:flagellar biosynthesis anti-sigma factor FlgM [Robertmurraya korlensis]